MSVTPYLIYDLVLLAILALFAWHGAKKGLVYMLLGMLAVFVSTAGARVAANTLAPMVAEALEPKLAVVIEEQLEEQLRSISPGQKLPAEIPAETLLKVLKDLGFPNSVTGPLQALSGRNMLTTAAGAAAAAAASAAQTVASSLIFSLSFFLILTIWKIFSRTMKLMARLPVIRTFNKTGGAALGLLIGCAILFAAGWIVRFLGNIIPEEAVQHTYLLPFFLTKNPIALLLGV